MTKSSCEAEYVALDSAASEAIWLRQLMLDLGYPQVKPTLIFEDNNGSISLALNPEHHNRTKHIDVRYHYIRQLIENHQVELAWCDTNAMIADILTKPLGTAKFHTFSTAVGLG